jgi:glutaredoxin-related protein
MDRAGRQLWLSGVARRTDCQDRIFALCPGNALMVLDMQRALQLAKLWYILPMQKPEITAYLKTYCGWSAGVRAVLAKYNLPYTEKDIIQNPAFRWEMETKSGQPLSPCVEINGHMLADVSGEEVEHYLIENKVVEASDAATDVPTNAPCPNELHEGVVRLNL